VTNVVPLPGGASSLTYVAELDGAAKERVVVKVAPPGMEPVRNRDVLRQARVLEVLTEVPGVAAPEVLGTDAGDPPEVPPLFVMSFVEGESVEPFTEPDPNKVPPPLVVEARARAATRMLAALHTVDLGRPQFAGERTWTPEDEVHRWTRTFDSLDDDLRPPTAAACRDRLLERLPARVPPTLVHGDWRLGNMLCGGSTVRAIIDWEIWSLADPRVDLAWYMLLADPTRPQNVRSGCGLPHPGQLAQWYAVHIGATISDLPWFAALVRYKQAAAAAFIVKNNRRLDHSDPSVERHGVHGAGLLQAALGFLR
jgi:aminoglycoside phosphotransferase (APT) family kinase protein